MPEQSKKVIVIAITISAIFFLLAARVFYEMRQHARIASCMNDIRMVHNAFDVYAEQHSGLLPPISATRGNLMMDPEGFYPGCLPSSCWLQCEWGDVRRQGNDKNRDLGREGFNDDSFVYIPWEIRNDAEAMAFVEAYKTLDMNDRDKDLRVNINGFERVLPRTRHVPWDTESDTGIVPVPVFIEWPDHYHKNSVVVLSNGTAVRREFCEPFPITDDFIAALREIATLDGPLPSD